VRAIARLLPAATLAVFVIPFIMLSPLKFLEAWLIVTQRWINAVAALVLTKLLGVGVTVFIFEATKDKLLQMVWFPRVYAFFIWLRQWAHQKVQPVARRLRIWRHVLRLRPSGRFIARLMRVRRRMCVAAAY